MMIDGDLKLSCEKFKDILAEEIRAMLMNGMNLTPLDSYPNPCILVQLAQKVYTNRDVAYTTGILWCTFPSFYPFLLRVPTGFIGNYVDYERKLALPAGWKLLTIAWNQELHNGYFGAAYWCPTSQQVVIAHRGTGGLVDISAWYTNIMGIVNLNYTERMNSAITFSHKIKCAIQDINREYKVHLQLSVTGHSLGGWLAQVSAFSLKYLQSAGDNFIMIPDAPVTTGIHAHVVVFDSPGCKDMLKNMLDASDFRYNTEIALNKLDVTNYLAPPNLINSTGSHLGMIYRVFINLGDFGLLDKISPAYNMATHAIEKFVEAFQNHREIHKVLDWPIWNLRGWEYNNFHKKATNANNYHLEHMSPVYIKGKPRYKTEDYFENVCSLRIFSKDEIESIDSWSFFMKSGLKLTKITKLLSLHELVDKENLFGYFQIDKNKQTITCGMNPSEVPIEHLQKAIRCVKQLLRWPLEEVMSTVKEQRMSAGERLCWMKSRQYRQSMTECHVVFKPSEPVVLMQFLYSNVRQILHIETPDSFFEAVRLYGEFRRVQKRWKHHSRNGIWDQYLSSHCYTFINSAQIQSLEIDVDIHRLKNMNILIIENVSDFQNTRKVLKKIFVHLNNNVHKKIIFIDSHQTDIEDLVTSYNLHMLKLNRKEISFKDLTKKSQKNIFSRMFLIFGKEAMSLQECLGVNCNLTEFLQNIKIDSQWLKNIVINKNNVMKIENPILESINSELHFTRVNREVSIFNINRVLRLYSPDAVLVVSQEDLEDEWWEELVNNVERITLIEDGEEIFKQVCHENPNKTVYWLEKFSEHIQCKQIYNRNLYISKQFDTNERREECCRKHEILIILNESDSRRAISLTSLSTLITSSKLWIITIDFENYQEKIKNLSTDLNLRTVSEFLLTERSNDSMQNELLQHCLKSESAMQVYLLFYGFEDINESRKKSIVRLLQYLKNKTTASMLVITTCGGVLEAELSEFALLYEINTNEEDHLEFLKMFWRTHLSMDLEQHGEYEDTLHHYAEMLYQRAEEVLGEDENQLMGIRLKMRMLAEVFLPQNATTIELQEPFSITDVCDLYYKFIKHKYDFYLRELGETIQEGTDSIIKDLHRELSLQILFPKYSKDNLVGIHREWSFEMSRVGLVQLKKGNDIEFIHHSFAEYFCADLLVYWLYEQVPYYYRLGELIIFEILLQPAYKNIRFFFNNILGLSLMTNPLSEPTLRLIFEKVCNIWDRDHHSFFDAENNTPLNIAIEEGNQHIEHLIVLLVEMLEGGY